MVINKIKDCYNRTAQVGRVCGRSNRCHEAGSEVSHLVTHSHFGCFTEYYKEALHSFRVHVPLCRTSHNDVFKVLLSLCRSRLSAGMLFRGHY